MLLRVCNLWFNLRLSKVGQFTGKALGKICRRVDKLPSKALVETCFYLTQWRKELPMISIESRFSQIFDELNIDEIGIVCLAFFKTESKLQRNELIDKLYDKTISDMDIIRDITMVNILKILRYSSNPLHAKKMEMLSDALLPKVDQHNILTCLHMILLGTNLQYCHHDLISAIARKFSKNLKKLRLKDIERMTFALGLFDFKMECGFEKELLVKVIEELKLRVDEILIFPRCLPATAHYLTLSGVHDAEVFKSVLTENFIKFAYGEYFFNVIP